VAAAGCGFDEWTLRKVDQPVQSAGEALCTSRQNAAVKFGPGEATQLPTRCRIVMSGTSGASSGRRGDDAPSGEGIFSTRRSSRDSLGLQVRRRPAKAAQAIIARCSIRNSPVMLREDKAKLESARKSRHLQVHSCPITTSPASRPGAHSRRRLPQTTRLSFLRWYYMRHHSLAVGLIWV